MCIFCKIIEGEIPSRKVYEDDDILAILDISQTTRGHTLVMPKKHYDDFLQMPEKEFGALMEKVQQIADRIVKKMNAKGCNILINTGETAGQTVRHAHVHIIPRYDENDTVSFSFTENQYDLDEILKKIKEN
ncbi:MAG: HIT family protein [Erysipelotrichaceae bacterium]|nr:HIT family protein [Erysipelotrichaceae bacterium]MBQ1533966.1 HIT family protein [Erysipelotrichaceae bacterium]